MAGTVVDLDYYGDWYSPGIVEIDNRGKWSRGQTEVLASVATKYNLDKATSMLSIGTGPGFVDVPLIRDCMPSLKWYYGIEPRPDAARECKESFQKEIGDRVKAEIFDDGVQNWKGPTHGAQVDVILAIQSMYYIPERFETLKRCLEWLKPGGLLCIGHCPPEGIFCQLSNLDYTTVEIGKDLKTLGIKEWQEEVVPLDFDLRNMNQILANICLHKIATEEDIKGLQKWIDEHATGGILKEYPLLICVTK